MKEKVSNTPIPNNKTRTTLLSVFLILHFLHFRNWLKLSTQFERMKKKVAETGQSKWNKMSNFFSSVSVSWVLRIGELNVARSLDDDWRNLRELQTELAVWREKLWLEMESEKCMWLECIPFVVMIWPHPLTWLDHTHTTNPETNFRVFSLSIYLWFYVIFLSIPFVRGLNIIR